jgi:putative ABC transport system ATP-binding protein
VARGEFVAVMGASGSGKSTLLHLVAGLTRADEGSVTIDGTDLFALSDSERTRFRRRHIGLIFQAFNLIPSLTGEENITLPMLLGRRADDPDGVRKLIGDLGLTGTCDRRPDAMSGGEQQRVAIGRALVTLPSLVLADEPTGSLDSINGRKLCTLLKRLCAEEHTAVLMVTHNPVVAFWAERIIILRDGLLVREFKRDDTTSLQAFTQQYVDAMEGTTIEVSR